MFDPNRGFSRECTEDHECSTFDVVRYHCSVRFFRCILDTLDDDMMIVGGLDTHTYTSEKVDETDHMWLDRPQFDHRLSFSECCHHEDILSRRDSEIPSQGNILSMICSLESDILTFTHILITIHFECSSMFIDGTFSDIASTWIGDLESTESLQESRKEKYSHTYFLDLITIEGVYIHFRGVEGECSIFFEGRMYSKRFDNREKREDVANMGNIMECEMIEKKSTGNKRKRCIFGSGNFDSSRE